MAQLKVRFVGTGALVLMDTETGEVKRMSVTGDLRQRGIGRLILEQLWEQAKE